MCIRVCIARPDRVSLRDLSGKTDVLMQPKENAQTKLKSRLPPKQDVKTDSFQGIQLKPVTKEGKQPQQAENGKIELKVALMGKIATILFNLSSRALFSMPLNLFSKPPNLRAQNLTVNRSNIERYFRSRTFPFSFQRVSYSLNAPLIDHALSKLTSSVNNYHTLHIDL